jgi:hypothetical protein
VNHPRLLCGLARSYRRQLPPFIDWMCQSVARSCQNFAKRSALVLCSEQLIEGFDAREGSY